MSRYLLDTNVISHLIREPHGSVAKRIAEVGETNVATSIIVVAEIKFGIAKKGSRILSEQAATILAAIDVLPFAHPAEEQYGEIRAELERTGRPIGNNDLLIAAHALTLDSILVTDNIREFSRIRALVIENWVR